MVTDVRDLPEFSKISLDGSTNVELQIGDEQSVEVDVDDNLVDVITTEVSDGELTISSNESYSTSSGITVRITIAELQSVEVAGSGNVTASGLTGDSLSVTVLGSGDVVVTGTATKVTAHVTGSGDIDLTNLKAETVTADVTGSGDIDVTASGTIAATVSGSGDITYSGHSGGEPTVTSTVHGSGDVEKR